MHLHMNDCHVEDYLTDINDKKIMATFSFRKGSENEELAVEIVKQSDTYNYNRWKFRND